jgi:hypothetical protein
MLQKTIKTGEHPEKTVPLSEAAACASRPDPEFVDCKGLEAGWGIKRSLAYALLADGRIKGVSLRRRNQIRGKRLFSVDSVREFLHAQMEGQ